MNTYNIVQCTIRLTPGMKLSNIDITQSPMNHRSIAIQNINCMKIVFPISFYYDYDGNAAYYRSYKVRYSDETN